MFIDLENSRSMHPSFQRFSKQLTSVKLQIPHLTVVKQYLKLGIGNERFFPAASRISQFASKRTSRGSEFSLLIFFYCR